MDKESELPFNQHGITSGEEWENYLYRRMEEARRNRWKTECWACGEKLGEYNTAEIVYLGQHWFVHHECVGSYDLA